MRNWSLILPDGHPRALGNAPPAVHAAALWLTTVQCGITTSNYMHKQQQYRQKNHPNIAKHCEGGVGKMDAQLQTNQAHADAANKAKTDKVKGKQASKANKATDTPTAGGLKQIKTENVN